MRINLSDARGRDAVVEADGTRKKRSYRYVDLDAQPVQSVQVVRGTLDQDLASLIERYGDIDTVAEGLVAVDRDVDMEQFGSFLSDSSNVFINADGEIARSLERIEIAYTPEGEERERRPVVQHDPNVADTTPLRWTGRQIPKRDAIRQFVFTRSVQLSHVNGLTYDFLFEMAKELHDAESLLLLGAGPKGTDPLVFRRGGRPYRGFLDGRVEGSGYLLLLHLSNLELRSLARP